MVELTTVTDSTAVFHDGTSVLEVQDLDPGTAYTRHEIEFRTLPRPAGRHLATVATVNDTHIGENECGKSDDTGLGPVLRSEPGSTPYPELMSRAAAEEMAAVEPDLVLAKGDLTARAAPAEIDSFFDCYRTVFGDRLHFILGNHDMDRHGPQGWPASSAGETLELDGARLALLDTTAPGEVWGALADHQLEWLDDVAESSDRPVMVFGHHPPWDPASPVPGITEADTLKLVEVVARRSQICGYFAGHTHRNRVTRLAATGDLPWSEVSATKDFPGAWAEYRIYETGVLAITHRVSAPEALEWTERTRAMFGGLYPLYSFGELADRCFPIAFRDGS